jgi:hypothetical protein
MGNKSGSDNMVNYCRKGTLTWCAGRSWRTQRGSRNGLLEEIFAMPSKGSLTLKLANRGVGPHRTPTTVILFVHFRDPHLTAPPPLPQLLMPIAVLPYGVPG